MFFGCVLILAAIVTACICVAASITAVWAIILMVIGSFIVLVLLWALMATIAVQTVHFEDEVIHKVPLFLFVGDCILSALHCIFRFKIHLEGEEKMPEGMFLLVSNHRSSYDPIIHMVAFRDRKLAFVGKESLFKVRVVGKLEWMNGCVPFRREDSRDAVRMIRLAVSRIKDGGFPMGIYPEGTRNRGEGMLPFRSGSFKIAKKAEVPVVVLYTRNSDAIKGNFPWRSTPVDIEVCDVIDVEYVMSHSTAEISDKARQIIFAAMERAGSKT